MVTQKDLEDIITAVNEIFMTFDKRIADLEEAAKKQSSTTSRKKVQEKA